MTQEAKWDEALLTDLLGTRHEPGSRPEAWASPTAEGPGEAWLGGGSLEPSGGSSRAHSLQLLLQRCPPGDTPGLCFLGQCSILPWRWPSTPPLPRSWPISCSLRPSPNGPPFLHFHTLLRGYCCDPVFTILLKTQLFF